MTRWTLLPPRHSFERTHPIWIRQLNRAQLLPAATPGLHGAMPSRYPYAQLLSGHEGALIADIVVARADATGARVMELGVDTLDPVRAAQLEATMTPWLPAGVTLTPIVPGRWLLQAHGQSFRGLSAIDPEGVLGAQLAHWLPAHRWLASLCNELQMALSMAPKASPWNMLWCWGDPGDDASEIRSIQSDDPLLRTIPMSPAATIEVIDWRRPPVDGRLKAGTYRSLDGQGWLVGRLNAWRAMAGV